MHADPIIDKIIVARISLLLKHPFFGNLATRLQIQDATEWCPTAATDGRNVYFNRDFFEKLSEKHIEFVLAHEILHNVFDHLNRAEDRDKRVFNVAADYCVNGQLVRDKIGDHNVPDIQILHDVSHYNKSAEQIYDEIYESVKNDELDQLGQLLDEHIDWGSPGAPGQPSYSKEELNQIRNEMREAIIEAAQSVSAGNVPAMVKRMISELTEPKMNWRELLRQQIQSSIKSDYSWARPSRKAWHIPAILPGTNYADTIDICVAIDTSGSISDSQTKDFLSEVKGIMDEYKDYSIKVICFDTRVYNEKDYSGYESDIDSYELMGGGGTNFMCVWDYLKAVDSQPKKLLMFTDGYPFGSWGDDSYCDTLFVIHGNNKTTAPFGTTVYYENGTST